MARLEVRTGKKKLQAEHLPFTRTNYQILLVGLLVISLGYYALAQEPWDGTMPLVVAPILLVIGYCVIIPIGILYRRKQEAEGAESGPQSAQAQ